MNKITNREKVIERLQEDEWWPYKEGWDETTIREFIDYIDWGVLFNYPTFDEDFVREVLMYKQPNDWEYWMNKVTYKKKKPIIIKINLTIK